MTIYSKSTDAQLNGDLTNSGMNLDSIDSLEVSLRQIDSGGKKTIRIDCGGIGAADICGLRLLYVWLQCFRLRGVEPELVNLSVSLRHAIQKMGLGHCFSANCAYL